MTGELETRIGCDVQSSVDVCTSLSEFGDRYLRRLLSGRELTAAADLSGTDALGRYVAGRFAAKEAVYKLLGGGPESALGWPQIEILRDGGMPRVHLSGTAADLAAAAGIGRVAVSISHADPFVFAVAAAIAGGPAPAKGDVNERIRD